MKDKSHGKGREGIQQDNASQERNIRSIQIRKNTKPFLLVGFEKGNPFEKLVLGDSIPFTELFNGVKSGKVFAEYAQDKEQAVAGVRDNDIGKDGMCMVTAVTENPEDA